MFHLLIVFFLMVIATSGSAQKPKLMLPLGHAYEIKSAEFSPDGKKIVTVSIDGTAKLWEASSGKLVNDLRTTASGDPSLMLIKSVKFVPGGNKILLRYNNGEALLMDVHSGKEIYFGNGKITVDQFSSDGKKMVLSYRGGDTIYNSDTGTPVIPLKTNGPNDVLSWSPDGKTIVSGSPDSTIRIWNAITGKQLTKEKKMNDITYSIHFTPDSKQFLLSMDHSAVMVDATTLNIIATLENYISLYEAFSSSNEDVTLRFSPDGKKLAQLTNTVYKPPRSLNIPLLLHDSLRLWDTQNGKVLFTLGGLEQRSDHSFFSPDNKKIVIVDTGRTAKVRDVRSGDVLFELASTYNSQSARFDPDGKKILVATGRSVKIFNADNGDLVSTVAGNKADVSDAQYSKNGKWIVTASDIYNIETWDAGFGKKLVAIPGKRDELRKAAFSEDGKSINILSTKGVITWDITNRKIAPNHELTFKDFAPGGKSGKGIFSSDSTLELMPVANQILEIRKRGDSIGFAQRSWAYETDAYRDARYSPDEKKLLVTTHNNTLHLLDRYTMKLLFTLVVVDSNNFLIADAKGHYDGTEKARELIHFTCGDEVIELDQVKDQLWVPELADRINSGDNISAITLDDLNICGLTPLLEDLSTGDSYRFKIIPRRGGVGETSVYINGIVIKTYLPSVLKKTGTDYEIKIPKEQLRPFFVEEQENIITVRSQTADNAVASRWLTVIEDPVKEKKVPPNLFGVVVGVSNYKGDRMDLDYAAVDAKDISTTIEDAAKKLLGKDHVFMYRLTTDSGYTIPEKKAIKKTFDEIAAKAGPNDILFIFLSGHGVMDDKTKQFYYMTVEASSLSDEAVFKDVGISMNELTDWIKPQSIKAQKRILILDACKSGQAINNLMKVAQAPLAVKGDDNSLQLKAIDKLNEKSGLFILSASASGELAFESGIYGHGYLTYSLLKVIKEKPDILEDGKFLNVSRWFNAAAQTVSELAKEDRASQEPQIVTNTDFNVGLVDNDVMSKINLSETKIIFASGNFLNPGIVDDDLGLRNLVDKQLGDLSRLKKGKKILFISFANSPETWSLNGTYTIKDDSVTVKVSLKQDKKIKQQFDMVGSTDKPKELADAIIAKAVEWIESDK